MSIQQAAVVRSASPRALADRAFSRAAGAPLIGGNDVRLLLDAGQNYPAWLDAIDAARHHVHFESYIIYDDDVGQKFADALCAKARQGVRVRVVYDWLGGLGKTSHAFWSRLRSAGVDVRCYNPLRLSSPLGWLSRDHRKALEVDARVAFVSGLCVGRKWAGNEAKGLAPWRDTGVVIRGPAVAEIQRAFAEIWATMGDPIPPGELTRPSEIARQGATDVRVVATSPASGGLFRLDQLVAELATRRLWLADAYFAGTTTYVQALCASAHDGVDVRLLLPNTSDIPLVRLLSRTGYRPLLQAGVRVFEWNGPMMHAKTAVADGRWARIGSTNLNIASWFGNYELDLVVEDEDFGLAMEEAYLRDLANATEVVLSRNRLQPPPLRRPAGARDLGSASRLAASVTRLGHTVAAASTNRRELEPAERRIMLASGVSMLALAVLFFLFPRLLAYPFALGLAWIALALLARGHALKRPGR